MSKSSNTVLAAAVGAAFLTMVGCASQGSPAGTPAPTPNSCSIPAVQASCKNMANCSTKKVKHHKKAVVVEEVEAK